MEERKILGPVEVRVVGVAEIGAMGVAKIGAIGVAETRAASVVGMGAVGITVFAATSGSSGISVVKRMNMQNDLSLHQEVM